MNSNYSTPSARVWPKILIFTCMACALFAVCLTVYLVSDLPLDKLEKVNQALGGDNTTAKRLSVLEEGSIVSFKELKNFYLFSHSEKKFKKWLEQKEQDNILEIKGRYIYVKQEVQLEALMLNTCKDAQCFQHKIIFDRIPSIFWKGLIGIEDLRFLDHFGIDLKSILRALVKDIQEMRLIQGGSTLTQQLVKNLFFSNKRSIIRKLKEIILAIYIENRLDKENILEAYFNEVYWGSLQGFQIRGVYAAALFYFNKRIDELSPYEAAILISLLKGPGYYSPVRHLDRLKQRTAVVYERLVELKLFSATKSLYWSKKRWNTFYKNLIKRNKRKPFYALALRRDSREVGFVGDYEEYILLKKVKDTLANIQTRYKTHDLQAKIILGKITKNKGEVFRFYSRTGREVSRVFSEEKHQVGSILKPLLYSIYLRNGASFQDEVSMEKITLALKSGKWSPKEAHKDLPEKVTLREALLHSYNRPVIRLANQIGFDQIETELLKYLPEMKTPLAEYPAQLLGAIELSLDQVYDLYRQYIINECEHHQEWRDQDNSPLFLLSTPKNTTVRKVIGEHLKELKFFGKTGTSNNGFNNWFVFYEGRHLGVIWVGFEGARTGKNFRLYGSTTAFKIFQDFFRDRGKTFNELSCDNLTN